MTTAIDVGQYIYSKMGWIDAWRLQKLTYYSHVWALAWSGRPLVDDEFQAWSDGPVAPRLHQANKYSRTDKTSTELPGANPGNVTPAQQAMIDAVIDFYGSMSKPEIIERTHGEDPWKTARGDLGPDEKCWNNIDIDEMKRFYSTQRFSGEAVPDPPRQEIGDSACEVPADKQYALMMSNRTRWSAALELLADR